MRKEPYEIGEHVDYGGSTVRVVAVLWIGERYYIVQYKNGTIALLPAQTLENQP